MEANLRKFNTQTVTILVHHICQTLPTADGGYCTPLVFDYLKALASILQYKAHLENLQGEIIESVIDFCLRLVSDVACIRNGKNEDSLENVSASSSQKSLSFRLSGTSTSTMGAGRSSSNRAITDMRYPELQSSAITTVSCLQNMVSVPGIDVSDKSESLLNVLFELLHNHPNATSFQQSSFETISFLMPRIMVSNISLAIETLQKCIQLLRSVWQTRTSGVREALLSILLYGECIIADAIAKSDAEDFDNVVCEAIDVLRQEYCERRPKETLLLDDLEFGDYTATKDTRSVLTFKLANLRGGSSRIEESWGLLRVSAAMIMVLDQRISIRNPPKSDAQIENPTKRQRLMKPFEEAISHIRSASINREIYALQIASMIFDMSTFDAHELRNYMSLITPCISDNDNQVASWAMFALAW